MLTQSAISIVFFAVGTILGIYLPLALAYLVSKFRRTRFSIQIIWQVMLRLAAILFLYFLLLAGGGILLSMFGEKPEDVYMLWNGVGFILGLVTGILLFFIGFLKGRGQTASGQSS